MKKDSRQLYIIYVIFLFSLSIINLNNIANAQNEENISTTSTTTINKEEVDISLPILKNDFLLFYGVTGDKDTDTKLLELRKDFTKKFSLLKDDYQKSFDNIVGDKTLLPVVSLDKQDTDIKTTPQTASLKSVKIETQLNNINNLKTNSVLEDKSNATLTSTNTKYILNNLKDVVVSPIVNIINDTPTLKIENSSWFQKIKTWFGW